jgi:hypothetical protein
MMDRCAGFLTEPLAAILGSCCGRALTCSCDDDRKGVAADKADSMGTAGCRLVTLPLIRSGKVNRGIVLYRSFVIIPPGVDFFKSDAA